MSQAEAFRAELGKIACRVLHFGVGYGDFQRASAATDWRGWSERLAAVAAACEDAADRHGREGRRCSAVALWRRAAACYHYAQLKLRGEARQRLAARCRASYAKCAPHLEPAAHPLEIRWAGGRFPGYLRVARHQAPWVLLVNGLDSAKEVELDHFAKGFLERGSTVLYFDGPGQGEAAGEMPASRFSEVVSAAVDTLKADPRVGDVPGGIFGVSFGGHLACRAAALDGRIAACVSLGGFHDARVLHRLPPPARERLRRAYGLTADAPLGELDPVVTLAPLRGRMDRPLLIVHGTADHLVDHEQVEALARWVGLPGEVRTFPGAEHVCTDRFGECLPELWDWMTARLAEAGTPSRRRRAGRRRSPSFLGHEQEGKP